MGTNKQSDLGMATKLLVGLHDSPQGIAMCNDDKVGGRNRQHVFDHTVDVLVAEAISERN